MTDQKMRLADLQESGASSARKHLLEHTMSTANALTKRTYAQSESQQQMGRGEALASYRKHFTPIFAMDTIRVEPSLSQKAGEEGQPRRKLNFGQQSPLRPTADIGSTPQLEQKLSMKTTTATKRSIKQTILLEDLQLYNKPANLEYELRKKRFFQCFQGKSQHEQSYSHLARKLRLDY